MSNGVADVVRQAHAVGGNQIYHISGQQAEHQGEWDMARQGIQSQRTGARAKQ